MAIEEENDLKERFSTVRDVDKVSSSASSASSSVTSKDIIEEVMTICGEERTVHRYYVSYSNGFRGVGWIIDSDIDSCLICSNEFGLFLRKHHCRSCGNILCDDCCNNFVVIEEMKEFGEQRVCHMCYWGQSVVYATNTRPQDEEDEDQESFEEEDFIIASKINATINASVKSYRLLVNKFPLYSGEMILEQESDWKTITKCVIRDLNIYADLQTALTSIGKKNSDFMTNGNGNHGDGKEEDHHHSEEDDQQQAERIKSQIKELIQQLSIKYFVLLDADGESLSPKLDNSRLFWQFIGHYSVIQKTSFMVSFGKGSQSILELAKRGRLITEEIQKVIP